MPGRPEYTSPLMSNKDGTVPKTGMFSSLFVQDKSGFWVQQSHDPETDKKVRKMKERRLKVVRGDCQE